MELALGSKTFQATEFLADLRMKLAKADPASLRKTFEALAKERWPERKSEKRSYNIQNIEDGARDSDVNSKQNHAKQHFSQTHKITSSLPLFMPMEADSQHLLDIR